MIVFCKFVIFIWHEKRPDNTVIVVGFICEEIKIDLQRQNISLNGDAIFITDKKLLRALRDSKVNAGKAIDAQRLYEIVHAIQFPTAILKDKRSGQLVYIYTREYNDMMLKVVVEPNVNINSNVINIAKSIGVVAMASLKDKFIYEVIFGKI